MKLRNLKKTLKKEAIKRYYRPIDINNTYCQKILGNKIFPNGKCMMLVNLISKSTDKVLGFKYFYIKLL